MHYLRLVSWSVTTIYKLHIVPVIAIIKYKKIDAFCNWNNITLIYFLETLTQDLYFSSFWHTHHDCRPYLPECQHIFPVSYKDKKNLALILSSQEIKTKRNKIQRDLETSDKVMSLFPTIHSAIILIIVTSGWGQT